MGRGRCETGSKRSLNRLVEMANQIWCDEEASGVKYARDSNLNGGGGDGEVGETHKGGAACQLKPQPSYSPHCSF